MKSLAYSNQVSGKIANAKAGKGWNRLKQEELGSDSDHGIDPPDNDVRDRSPTDRRFEHAHLVDKQVSLNA